MSGKCIENAGKSALKRALLHGKKQFSCTTKHRFEPLAPIESSCTENGLDLIEDFNCSSDKHSLDTSLDTWGHIGQAGLLNRKVGPNNKRSPYQDDKTTKNFPSGSYY